jgi:hypothetical protein
MCWENWISSCRKLKTRSLSSTCTNINSKCTKDLNVRPEYIGKVLKDTGIGTSFLNRTPRAQEIRARIDKWDSIKLKSFCTAKEAVT